MWSFFSIQVIKCHLGTWITHEKTSEFHDIHTESLQQLLDLTFISSIESCIDEVKHHPRGVQFLQESHNLSQSCPLDSAWSPWQNATFNENIGRTVSQKFCHKLLLWTVWMQVHFWVEQHRYYLIAVNNTIFAYQFICKISSYNNSFYGSYLLDNQMQSLGLFILNRR